MDDVARAVGAGKSVKIDGIECKLKPLSIKELTTLERDCLSFYRSSYLSTYKENAHILGEKAGIDFLIKKMEEAARFDIGSLPPKYEYDRDKIPLNRRLFDWVEDNMQGYDKANKLGSDIKNKILVKAALESGLLSEEQYVELVGTVPHKTTIPYVSWWISSTMEGRLGMVYHSLAHTGISKERLEEVFSERPELLVELAREVEHLSVPAAGNG